MGKVVEKRGEGVTEMSLDSRIAGWGKRREKGRGLFAAVSEKREGEIGGEKKGGEGRLLSGKVGDLFDCFSSSSFHETAFGDSPRMEDFREDIL